MVRLGIGNAWKWAVPQLVGFVILLCWVDSTSRPIIALFLFFFLAILGIRIFQQKGTPPQTLPTSNDVARAFVAAAATRLAKGRPSVRYANLPPSSPDPQPSQPATTADPSSKVGESEASLPPKRLPSAVVAPMQTLPAGQDTTGDVVSNADLRLAVSFNYPPADLLSSPLPKPVTSPPPNPPPSSAGIVTTPQQTLPTDHDVAEVVVGTPNIRLRNRLQVRPRIRVRRQQSSLRPPQQTSPTNYDVAEVAVSPGDVSTVGSSENPAPKPVTSPAPNPPPSSASIVTAPQQTLPTNHDAAEVVVPSGDVSSVGNVQNLAPNPVSSPPPNPPALSASIVTTPQEALPINRDTAEVVVSSADVSSVGNSENPAPNPVASPPPNPPPSSESIVTAPQQTLPTNHDVAEVVLSSAEVSSVGNSQNPAPKPVTSPPPNPLPTAPTTAQARPRAVAINNYTAIAFRPKIASKPSNPPPLPPSGAIAAPPIPQRASTDDSIPKPPKRKPRRRRNSRLLTWASRLKLNPRKKRVVPPSPSCASGESLIPLKADGSKPSGQDWMNGALHSIVSDKSVADRLSQLLKDLPAVNASDLYANSSQIAAKALLPPISITEKPEAQTSNFLPFERVLEGLQCFRQTRRLTDQENADLPLHWLFWRVDSKTVLSFSVPPVGSWNDVFKQEPDAWANFGSAEPAPATNSVSSLVHEAVKMGLLRPEHGETGDRKVFIPSGLTSDDRITLEHDGCKTWLKVGGHLTINKIDELLERCHHRLAISHRIRQDLIHRFGLDKVDSIHYPFRQSASSGKPH